MNNRRFFETGWNRSPNGNITKVVDGINYTIIKYGTSYSIYSNMGKVTGIYDMEDVKAEVYNLAYGYYPDDDYPEDNSNSSSEFFNNPMFKEIIKQGYKQLSKKYHPDIAGGDAEKMKRLNNLYDELKERL